MTDRPMVPADVVKVDRLADLVCHPAQLDVWADAMIVRLAPYLLRPENFEVMVAQRVAMKAAIRELVERAFAHPEILEGSE